MKQNHIICNDRLGMVNAITNSADAGFKIYSIMDCCVIVTVDENLFPVTRMIFEERYF